MTQSLKIECLVTDLALEGEVASFLVTKEQLTAGLSKKADLVDGKIEETSLPDFIASGFQTVNQKLSLLETSVTDGIQSAKDYAEAYADEKLIHKADLVDGKVPASQLPSISEYSGLSEALTSVLDQARRDMIERTDEIQRTKADIGEDGKVLREQLPNYDKIPGLETVVTDLYDSKANISDVYKKSETLNVEEIEATVERISPTREDMEAAKVFQTIENVKTYGASLPFEENREYLDGSVSFKDGRLQQKIEGEWKDVTISRAEQLKDKNGKNQQDVNDEVEKKLSEINKNIIYITTDTYDITDILNNAPSDTDIYIKNGNYITKGVKIEKDNVVIRGQSIDGVKIKLTAGADGIFLRFGKRGPSSDYHNDNLPQYNGTKRYYDEADYSPSSASYPRFKGSGIDGATFIISGDNGTGAATGLDFYRMDNPILNAKVKWESKISMGNGVRIHFCKNMRSDILEVDDNENSTYSVLYYWSYGLNAGEWKIGKGNVLSIDFKHSVNGNIRYLEARGRGGVGNSAVNFGYGGINNTVNKLVAIDGDVTIKASVEFDLQRDITIDDLYIDNPLSEGLTFIHASGVHIGKYFIRAKSPITLTTSAFYMYSNDRGITPAINTTQFKYDGNYSTTANESGYTKYFEKRPLPTLANSIFGKGELVATAGSTQCLLLNVAGGVVDTMNASGKVLTFNTVTPRGYKEEYRTTMTYENSRPFSVENVDFGDMSLRCESSALSTLTSMVQFTAPIVKCKGTFKTFADKKSLQFIWMFDSDITLETNKYLSSPSGYVIEMDSMVRSTLRGKWLANGRVINYKGGSAIYYTDGYNDHKLKGTIIRSGVPASSPPIITNFSTINANWKPVQLEGMKLYSEDGSNTDADVALIRHLGSIPSGYDNALGTGYVADKSCLQDQSLPFRRTFTNSQDQPPPYKPNYIEEYSVNTSLNIWWKANGVNTWVKL